MASMSEIIQRKQKFKELCGLVCPEFLKKGPGYLGDISKSFGDLEHTQEVLDSFRQYFDSRTQKVNLEIPKRPGAGDGQKFIDYRMSLVRIINNQTGFDLEFNSQVPPEFYIGIIKRL
jgi:hypothetical protein